MKAITIKDNEEYLRQISSEVKLNDKDLLNNIKVLEEFCINNKVMAMAAVQLGIPKRIIYIKNTDLNIINKIISNEISEEEEKSYNEARVLINPVIVNRYGLTEYWEACASCLDYCGLVRRPYKIEVEYYDLSGNIKRDIFVGLESTVLSHEMDHLDGILHMDKAIEVRNLSVEERKKLRMNHNYTVFYENGNYEDLNKKSIKKLLKKKEKETNINI